MVKQFSYQTMWVKERWNTFTCLKHLNNNAKFNTVVVAVLWDYCPLVFKRATTCHVEQVISVQHSHSTTTACTSVRITWKPEYAGPPHLFSLPHRVHAVVENFGTEGLHTYFSVFRLLVYWHTAHAVPVLAHSTRRQLLSGHWEGYSCS